MRAWIPARSPKQSGCAEPQTRIHLVKSECHGSDLTHSMLGNGSSQLGQRRRIETLEVGKIASFHFSDPILVSQ